MKQFNYLTNRIALLIASFYVSVLAFAQDDTKKIDINVNKGTDGNFFMQPWVWVVAGAIFILLLVALMRGNNNSNS